METAGITDPDGQDPPEGYAVKQDELPPQRLTAAAAVLSHILQATEADAEVSADQVTNARAQSHIAPLSRVLQR